MKILIAYYSYTGNTRTVAEFIKKELGEDADLAEIKTVEPYAGSYNDVVNQAKAEINSGFMPEIEPLNVNTADYDAVVLGSPVWWYTFAPAMKTFLNDKDFSGRKVYPFATNAGWLGHTLKDFEKACAGADVKKGLNVEFEGNVFSLDEKLIKGWIKTIKQ